MIHFMLLRKYSKRIKPSYRFMRTFSFKSKSKRKGTVKLDACDPPSMKEFFITFRYYLTHVSILNNLNYLIANCNSPLRILQENAQIIQPMNLNLMMTVWGNISKRFFLMEWFHFGQPIIRAKQQIVLN